MNAEQTLNYIERIITGNPHSQNPAWRREIKKRAGTVRKEIESLRRFAMLKPGNVQEITLSRAAFLEDRLNELLDQYQKGV